MGATAAGTRVAFGRSPARAQQARRRRVVPGASVGGGGPNFASRRAVVLAPLAGGFAAAAPSTSAQEITAKEVDAADSPMIQEMLARSAEKKEERQEERLRDYYRRNFKDYFQFQAGTCKGSTKTPECERVLQWLEDNK